MNTTIKNCYVFNRALLESKAMETHMKDVKGWDQ